MARILAVDDSEHLLLMIQAQLKAPEFEVVAARSGAAALEQVARSEFDLILLDVHMPGMDGFEVCRRLKEKDHTKWIPVIFLSGQMKETADHIQGLNTGAVDYIVKPIYDLELLRARIRAMLQVQQELRREKQRSSDLSQRVKHLEELVAAARDNLDDYRRAVGDPGEKRGIALLDRDLEVKAVDAAFRQGLAEPGLTALHAALRARPAGGSFALQLGGSQLEVEADWVGELLCVRVGERTVARDALARIHGREPLLGPPPPRNGEAPAFRIQGLVGCSPVLDPLLAAVDQLRHKRVTVLVHGESGTGKELVSRALHFGGPDAHRPFIPIHCGAISPELIESELFGYVKGAFTGASDCKQGLFSAADGGTIFLDEIAETSADLQVKLLRVLQNREIRPVGATNPLYVDVRIIAATNKDLAEMVRQGKFREDLFYRLEVVTLDVPPLRRRVEDIPELVAHFIAKFNKVHQRTGRAVAGIARGALRRLCAYPWPGNVRELENVIERAFALSAGDTLLEQHLPDKILTGCPALQSSADAEAVIVPARSPTTSLRAATAESQRRLILAALERCNHDMGAAAAALQMSRSTLYRRCQQLGIPRRGHHAV